MPAAVLAEAKRHAARLIELMPDNPGSYEIMSYVLMHDAEQSLEEARRLATTLSGRCSKLPPPLLYPPASAPPRAHQKDLVNSMWSAQGRPCFLDTLQTLFSCGTLFCSDTVLHVVLCSHMEVALLTAEEQDNDVGVIQYALQVMYFLLWVSLHVLLWPL